MRCREKVPPHVKSRSHPLNEEARGPLTSVVAPKLTNAQANQKKVRISLRKSPKIGPRASWAALAKTNGLQVRLGSSPGAFLNIFGAPGSISQALLAGPGRPKSALGAPWARFWRPKHRTKSRPRVIVAALIVRERFGDDFRTIFDDVQSIFGRFGDRPWFGS